MSGQSRSNRQWERTMKKIPGTRWPDETFRDKSGDVEKRSQTEINLEGAEKIGTLFYDQKHNLTIGYNENKEELKLIGPQSEVNVAPYQESQGNKYFALTPAIFGEPSENDHYVGLGQWAKSKSKSEIYVSEDQGKIILDGERPNELENTLLISHLNSDLILTTKEDLNQNYQKINFNRL